MPLLLFFIIPLAVAGLVITADTPAGWAAIEFVLKHLYDLE